MIYVVFHLASSEIKPLYCDAFWGFFAFFALIKRFLWCKDRICEIMLQYMNKTNLTSIYYFGAVKMCKILDLDFCCALMQHLFS